MHRRGVWPYALALGAVTLAVLLRWALDPIFGDRIALVTFYLAIAVVAMVAGGRAGLVATIVSAIAVNWVSLGHGYRLTISGAGDVVGLSLFVAAGALISATAGMLGRARRREWEAAEREKVAEKVRESEERLNFALETSRTGAWELNLLDHTAHRSRQHDRIFGYTELLPKWTYEMFLDHVLPEDRAGVDARFRAAQKTGSDWSFECRIRRADQQVRWIWAAGRHRSDATGQRYSMAGIVQDITDTKLAQEAGERLAQQRQLALDAARLGWWHYDPATRIATWDDRYKEILGVTGSERPVEEILKRLHPEDRPGVWATVEAALNPADPKPFSAECRIVRDDGSVRWLEAHGIATFEGEGDRRRPISFVGTVQDITERKQFQAELERLVAERTAKLQELVGELEHFSYTITHDMRAPLRAMQGFADLMTESCATCKEEEPRTFLHRIRTAAARMDSLITDALNYNRTVRQELALAPVDPGALLRGMLDSYPELQPSRARVEIRGQLPLVMANEAGLTQCFSNLLNNAVKFVKPGEIPQIRIWAEPRDEWVRIWVEDDGIGIAKSMQSRVFDMFSRGHHSYEGTGIGLALVRKVATRMDGRVGVESEEGKGSRFWLELKPGDLRNPRAH